MVGIRYIEKSIESPNGKIIGDVYEEASWIYDENDFPFIFEIKKNGDHLWETYLYPNMWASWDCMGNEKLEAIIKDNNGNLISSFKLDIWCNRNSTEQFFDTWINKNPNSNGIVIGTHDGTSGEWVKHVKNKSTNVLLVEGSKKQFDDLVNNYSEFENVRFRNSVITSDGRYVEFFEYGTGHANTVSEDHLKKHVFDNDINILKVKSVGINELIIQEGFQNNIDWIHLDTEAIDDEIIMGLDFSIVKKPKLIVFETINFSEERTGSKDRIDKLFNWLESNGYKTKYDFWNSYAFLIEDKSDKKIFEKKHNINLKNSSDPKIRIVHLLLDPNEPKDIPLSSWESTIGKQNMSLSCWDKLSHKFYDYVKRYSIVNRTELPIENCKNSDIVNTSLEIKESNQELHYGHYGAYKAHVNAMLEYFDDDIDALIIAEGDSYTDLNADEFYNKVLESYNLACKIDARFITYAGIFYMTGDNFSEKEIDHGDWVQVSHFLMGTTYMIMKSERENLFYNIHNTGWHSPDIWLAWNYCNRVPMIASKENLFYQKEGYSLLDHKVAMK